MIPSSSVFFQLGPSGLLKWRNAPLLDAPVFTEIRIAPRERFIHSYEFDWTNPQDIRDAWEDLGATCQNGLSTAMGGSNSVSNIRNRLHALERTGDTTFRSTIQAAGARYNLDWRILAAVAIRESGAVTNAVERRRDGTVGNGRGAFQIDSGPNGQNPSVTYAEALDLAFSADWAARKLSNLIDQVAREFSNFTPDQVLQAALASYNFGITNISGDPTTIDVGTTDSRGEGYPGNYGSNVMDVLKCFQ